MNVQVHPMLKQLLDLGCSNLRIAPVAFAVYMDLAEVKAMWDLQYIFCRELDIIYLTAKENETDAEPIIYLPLPASHNVSAEWLLKAQNASNNKGQGLILALKDTDSTIVYYKISDGLISPDSPESMQKKKSIEERNRLMQTELWRKRNQIYVTATQDNQDKPS